MDSIAPVVAEHGTTAVAIIAGREVHGDLVGFSDRIAVIAFDRAQPVAVGSVVRLRLGATTATTVQDDEVTTRVLQVTITRDGRPAIAFTMPEDGLEARRADVRVPFDSRIDLIICDSRVLGDAHQSARAIDLSVSGISLWSDRMLPPMTKALLRFRLPGSQSVIQTRAQVRWCRAVAQKYNCGLAFTLLKGGQSRDLATAVVLLSKTQGLTET